jgi:hypothetical protein
MSFVDEIHSPKAKLLTPCLYFFAGGNGGVVPSDSGRVLSREEATELVMQIMHFYECHSDDEIAGLNGSSQREHDQSLAPRKSVELNGVDINPRSGYVYVLRADNGLFKIGRTSNPNIRLTTLGIKLPYALTIVVILATNDMHALESDLHERFASKRKKGEWFDLGPDDIKFVEGLDE